VKPIKDTTKSLTYRVTQHDVAAFNGEVVHAVCSTFTLAREIEWTTRQFVLDIRDDDEEGIGTHVSIDHKSPAFVGEHIIFTARIETLDKGELICSYEARVGERLIATGKTGQKILKREKIKKIFDPETRI
jgi:fluoroacetyl-CoA thioesterase